MTTGAMQYQPIMKEDGVSSLKALGLKVCGAFAKALWIERNEGHTCNNYNGDPCDACKQLDIAVQAEADALAKD